jgi:hypothetical protein
MYMKIKSNILLVVIFGTLFLLSSGCSGKKEQSSSENKGTSSDEKIPVAGAPQFSVEGAFQKQLSAVFVSYVALKDAFVASNTELVKAEAAKMMESLGKADMKLLTGAAHNDWMTYLGAMEGALKQMQASVDMEEQRTAFKILSDNLYKSIKAYGLGGTTAYYAYCPMAFNDTGAYWLSDNSKIRNPYFGDKMLTCGNVEEKLN